MLYEHDEILYSGPSDPILAPHEEIFNVLRFVCLFSMVFGKNNLQFFEKNEKNVSSEVHEGKKRKIASWGARPICQGSHVQTPCYSVRCFLRIIVREIVVFGV